jgi:hypothetical protein
VTADPPQRRADAEIEMVVRGKATRALVFAAMVPMQDRQTFRTTPPLPLDPSSNSSAAEIGAPRYFAADVDAQAASTRRIRHNASTEPRHQRADR